MPTLPRVILAAFHHNVSSWVVLAITRLGVNGVGCAGKKERQAFGKRPNPACTCSVKGTALRAKLGRGSGSGCFTPSVHTGRGLEGKPSATAGLEVEGSALVIEDVAIQAASVEKGPQLALHADCRLVGLPGHARFHHFHFPTRRAFGPSSIDRQIELQQEGWAAQRSYFTCCFAVKPLSPRSEMLRWQAWCSLTQLWMQSSRGPLTACGKGRQHPLKSWRQHTRNCLVVLLLGGLS